MKAAITLGMMIVLVSNASVAQNPQQETFDSAYYAWDAGDYVEALETLEILLEEEMDESLLERIALLTGEMYSVVEVAPDGRAVRWNPDGDLAAYETSSGYEATTHVVAVQGGRIREVISVTGSGAVFSPDGSSLAYLRVVDTPELRDARNDIMSAGQPRDRASLMRMQRELARIDAEHASIVVAELESDTERVIDTEGLAVFELHFGSQTGTLYFGGALVGETNRRDIYSIDESDEHRLITNGDGMKQSPREVLGGTHLAYSVGNDSLGVVELGSGDTHFIEASSPVISADGGTLTYVRSDGGTYTVMKIPLASGAAPTTVAQVEFPVAQTSTQACSSCPVHSSVAISPDGATVAFQMMPREDWEIYLTSDAEAGLTRVTRDIQHDLYPQFLTDGRFVAMKGEGRHRRSHLYDLTTGRSTRLFRNNTVRTVAPEYEWAVSPDATKMLIVADRDGDTISPERGVYLLDLTQRVSQEDLLARVQTNLAAERSLRERGRAMFGQIAEEVEAVIADISLPRIYEYEEDLFLFDSKFITQPGNSQAIDYLVELLRSFGYEPELQWFEPRGTRTANVIATLPGTAHPDLVYVISAHFDSSNRGPGSDDNSSATAGLLEAARVLARHPMPATIQFAFFTGEEAGLLGSREYVRRAVEAEVKLLGALNNDMVGWAENHRLDNTIRYSNAGIRDVQHSAAFLFSDLITYDAKYYRSTDAHAYYEAYGDIVGGIGSYPILASPHYHQVHDVLETVNHRLVTEVCKTTVASIMLLSSSPARLTGLEWRRNGNAVEVSWNTAPETDVVSYVISYSPESRHTRSTVTVTEARATLGNIESGTVIEVKAVNSRGMHGWDWARALVNR